MNLMGMVNGLNRMDDTKPFSPAAFTLAVKLIDLFNRLQWAEAVAVDLDRMRLMAKCTSRHTAIRARDELIERGVLTVVVKGKKGSPSSYGMADLQFGAFSAPNPALNPALNPAPINIKDKTISSSSGFLDDDEALAIVEAHSQALDAAERAGFPTATATQDRIVALVAEYGLEWVLTAIDRCVDQSNNKIKYLEAILRGFRRDGGVDNHEKAEPQSRPLFTADDLPVAPGDPSKMSALADRCRELIRQQRMQPQ